MFDFINYGADKLETFLLILFRCTGVLLMAPVLGHRSIPLLVKIGFAILLSLLLTSTLPPQPVPLVTSAWELSLIALKETLVGLIIGLAFYFVLYAVQLAGTLVGYQMGFAVANLFDPATSEQVPIIGQFWILLGMVIFLGINGHHLILTSFADSYLVMPAGAAELSGSVGEAIIRLSAYIFIIALKAAIPIVISLLLIDVALGVMSKAMPAANVYFVGAPIKIAVGLLVISVSLPLLSYVMEHAWGDIDAQLRGMLLQMGKA